VKKITLFMMALLVVSSLAAGTRKIYVQGKLTDSGGTALSGTQPVTFSLYSTVTGGTATWTGSMSVPLTTGGLFNVALQDGGPNSLDAISFTSPYYLGISVGGQEMTPRQELGSAAYAHGSPGNFTVAGNLGLGTSNPSSKLTVVPGADGVNFLGFSKAGEAAYMRFLNSAGSAYIGNINFGNDGSMTFGTAGLVSAMYISPTQNVGIGTQADPGDTLRYLDVQNQNMGSNAGVDVRLITRDASGASVSIVDMVKYKNGGFHISNSEAGSGGSIVFNLGGTERLRINAAGNVGIGTASPAYKLDVAGTIRGEFWTTSDKTFKKNIQALPSGTMEKLSSLSGVSFEWNTDKLKEMLASKVKDGVSTDRTVSVEGFTADSKKKTDFVLTKKEITADGYSEGTQIGLIAQDVEKVFPQLVRTDADGSKAVSYMGLTAVLLEAIKEQQARIAALEARVQLLEKK
jgi:hypothetical protein